MLKSLTIREEKIPKRVNSNYESEHSLKLDSETFVVPGDGRLAADLDVDATDSDLLAGRQLNLAAQHLTRLILILLVDVVLKVNLELSDR